MPRRPPPHCRAAPCSRSASSAGYSGNSRLSRSVIRSRPLDLQLGIIIGYDAVTLRERVDLRAAGERLDELGDLRSLSALNEKVTLLRLVGRLDEALDVANQAVRQARFTGDREQLVSSRIRRAQVMQYQGRLDEALLELGACVDQAETHEWTSVAAYARQHRGKVHFEQGNLEAALVDLRAAVFLREESGAAPHHVESSLIAVAVVESFLEERRQTQRSEA